jgi:hypothetical protein
MSSFKPFEEGGRYNAVVEVTNIELQALKTCLLKKERRGQI